IDAGAAGRCRTTVQVIRYAILVLVTHGQRTALGIHFGAGWRVGATVIGIVDAITVAIPRRFRFCRPGADAKQVVEAHLQGAVPMAVILAIEAQGFHAYVNTVMDFLLDTNAQVVGGAAVMAAFFRIGPEIPNPHKRIGAPAIIDIPMVEQVTVPPESVYLLAPTVLVQLHPVTHDPYRPLAVEFVTQAQANGGVIVQVPFLVKEEIAEAGGNVEAASFFPGICRPDQGQGRQ